MRRLIDMAWGAGDAVTYKGIVPPMRASLSQAYDHRSGERNCTDLGEAL